MQLISQNRVTLTGGYLAEKQELNRRVTLDAVYDRFFETGRITAFAHGYPDTDPVRPHYFWDSDVAKWMEGAAYALSHNPDPALEAKVDAIVEDIAAHQHEDGYFNIYFTVVEPDKRWANRDWHELYCAGHLMEAAVAYAEATGKTKFLACMEKYADYIAKVFTVEHSATFHTPGHEEIELALVRLYRHTGKKQYLDLAAYFINTRGTVEEFNKTEYNQSHLPVREQDSARGHAVRAMYLYTGMAYLAKETGDEALVAACQKIWKDVTETKMYVTGGLGSTYIGEAFTTPFDLPPDQAYTETCAGIALCFFANGMLALENNAVYADVIERALYNGVLSGLSHRGDEFFYENPLEVNLSERFASVWGARRFPAHRRVACFACSCCPPNINRLLASLGGYVFGTEGDTLYINQFMAATMQQGDLTATVETDYPRSGRVTVKAEGCGRLAIRIPAWCEFFNISHSYTMENGYAMVENDGEAVTVDFDLVPRAVFADVRVLRAAGRAAIMRGPVVYCAEGIDNADGALHNIVISRFPYLEEVEGTYGLPNLTLECSVRVPGGEGLYCNKPPKYKDTVLTLIPYNAFANRDETDMRVWFYV